VDNSKCTAACFGSYWVLWASKFGGLQNYLILTFTKPSFQLELTGSLISRCLPHRKATFLLFGSASAHCRMQPAFSRKDIYIYIYIYVHGEGLEDSTFVVWFKILSQEGFYVRTSTRITNLIRNYNNESKSMFNSSITVLGKH